MNDRIYRIRFLYDKLFKQVAERAAQTMTGKIDGQESVDALDMFDMFWQIQSLCDELDKL